MPAILCATTNDQKFGIGSHILAHYGLKLTKSPVDIDEIQGEEPEYIIRDKVEKAYRTLGRPVVVTDDSWSIPALNGFPGAYMKSINHWFTPDDFIRLMEGETDRRITLHQYLAYHDSERVHIFHNDLPGEIVTTPRGEFGPPIMHVVAMKMDEGLTISEAYDQGRMHDEKRLGDPGDAWHQLATWFKEQDA